MRKAIVQMLEWEEVKEILSVADSLRTGTENAQYDEPFCISVLSRLRKMNDTRPPCAERYAALLPVAEEVVGVKLTQTRNGVDSLIRKFIAYRLSEEGYGRSEIGRAMKRDHATVLNLYQRMNDIISMPRFYRREIGMYRAFEDRVGGPVDDIV